MEIILKYVFLLILIAEPFVKILLGEKWLPVVPIIQFFALARYITIICTVNVNILHVLGRTDLSLKQEYLKIPIRIIFIIAAVKYGIFYVALAELSATAVHFFINTYHPGKLTGYGAFSQIKDLFVSTIINSVLLVIGFLIMNQFTRDWFKLITPIVFYMSSYTILHIIMKTPEFIMVLNRSKKIVGIKK